jgi:uncharacterized protein (DUF305 family)
MVLSQREPSVLDARVLDVQTGRIAALVAAVGLVLAGCGDGDQGSDHNRIDLFFAQGMILHTAQAKQAAGLVSGRTTNSRVLDLAKQIQATDTAQFTVWVDKWGPIPNVTDASVTGVIGGSDLDRLRAGAGNVFDAAWLDTMIVHHRGAITMAETELNQGGNPEVRALARKVIDTQQPQLDQMQGMTGG